MKLLRQGRPAILHGAKVGFASLAVANLYRQLRGIDRAEAAARLDRATLPDPAREAAILARAFGAAAPGVAADHQAFLSMTQAQFGDLCRRIAGSWDQIQAIASRVPEPDDLAALLGRAGGVTGARGLGLADEEVVEGLAYGHYLRNRFTILKLARVLDLLPVPALTSGEG
jgi:glycerol-1-phosphate dehydrogenase [NAD(P)+]